MSDESPLQSGWKRARRRVLQSPGRFAELLSRVIQRPSASAADSTPSRRPAVPEIALSPFDDVTKATIVRELHFTNEHDSAGSQRTTPVTVDQGRLLSVLAALTRRFSSVTPHLSVSPRIPTPGGGDSLAVPAPPDAAALPPPPQQPPPPPPPSTVGGEVPSSSVPPAVALPHATPPAVAVTPPPAMPAGVAALPPDPSARESNMEPMDESDGHVHAPTATAEPPPQLATLQVYASQGEIASYLCRGEHSFDRGRTGEEDPTLPQRAERWRQGVERRLGHASMLRRNQAWCMAAMLLGSDTVHLAPTGSGKTLCFEVPALSEQRLVLVISPLCSLIESQCSALQASLDAQDEGGVARLELSGYFESTSEAVADEAPSLEELDSALRPGSLAWDIAHDCNLRAVFLTPEKLANPKIQAALAQVDHVLYVVDEGHCLSGWADWRPDYDAVGERLDSVDARRDARLAAAGLFLLRPPRHACTGTATRDDLDEIAAAMHMRDPIRIVCDAEAFARRNLHLMVQHADPAAEEAEVEHAKKLQYHFRSPTARAACFLLRRFYGVSSAFDDESGAAGCGIIYVRWASEAAGVAEAVSTLFRDEGIVAKAVVGTGTSKTEEEDAARRKANREALAGFNDGSIEWLVATCCVGMGIEFEREPRAILHLGFPPSAAEYVQEIGRGGRRGGRCDCVLYASLEMMHRTVVLLAKQRDGEAPRAVTRRLERFQDLLAARFCGDCRREALLSAVIGPELACQCPSCETCDRCCADGLCCEMTGGSEAERDLRGPARVLLRQEARLAQGRPLLSFRARQLWSKLPSQVASESGCTQLVLHALARRLLCFDPGASSASSRDGVHVVAREDRCALESMRYARVHSVPPAEAEGERMLGRLLDELRLMELQCQRCDALRDALQCECVRLAVHLGRTDLLTDTGVA